jgi:hypothetical protein
MNITPKEFIQLIKEGKTEKELNKTDSLYVDPAKLRKLTLKYGHTIESATEHLTTDYANGFTICGKCGSFYDLGEGFTKHLSSGCLNCEGEAKHAIYYVNASKPREGGFPARFMSVMFDDGMHYCKDKLQIGVFKKEIKGIFKKLKTA